MCGIIAFIRKQKQTKIKYTSEHLIRGAFQNRHRGDEDGFGMILKTNPIIDDTPKMYILKTLLELREAVDNKIFSNPTNKKAREGKDVALQGNLKLLDKLSKVDLSMGILHHRKATYGVPIGQNEIHPFKIKTDIQYMHNGSLYEYSMLKSFLEINDKMNFKTELDSEVLAMLAEDYLERNSYKGSAFVTLKRYLDNVSRFDYGILFRLDLKNDNITIIKCNNRSLYLVELNDVYMLVSEPLSYVTNYTQIIKLNEGVFNLTKNGLQILTPSDDSVEDVTDAFRYLGNFLTKSKKCDFCKDTKECHLVNHSKVSNVYICKNCYLLNKETTVEITGKGKKSLVISPPHVIDKFPYIKPAESPNSTYISPKINAVTEIPELVDGIFDEKRDIRKNLNLGLSNKNLTGLQSVLCRTQYNLSG